MAFFSIEIDRNQPLAKDSETGHNRWHPEVLPVIECESGDTIRLETRDALDGQLNQSSTPDDVAKVNMNRLHPLTGPVFVKGAVPGDLLEVEVLDVSPEAFGFTSQHPGFGLLRDWFPEAYFVGWELSDGYATSEMMPGVRIPGVPFMGVMGVAPSLELIALAQRREHETIAQGGLSYPPNEPMDAIPGGPPSDDGLRTGPPRENGGNMDIRHTGVGTKVFIPVFVEGALFSAGDAHFAQGDGEVCGAAIEMDAAVTVRLSVHAGRAAAERITTPQYAYRSSEAPGGREYYATTGMPIDFDGSCSSENILLASKRAILDMIQWMGRRGLSPQQAYALCSVAVDLRLSEVVNAPNVIVSARVPLDIFTS